MDTKLVALARAADEGVPCLRITLFAGALLVHGTPGSSEEFPKRVRKPLGDSIFQSMPSRDQAQRTKSGEWADFWEPIDRALQPVADTASTEEDQPTLTLLDAEVWPVTGGVGVGLPAVRISIAAITAWWFAGSATQLPAPSGAVGFFGVSVDL
jgi:hypothetical protein